MLFCLSFVQAFSR